MPNRSIDARVSELERASPASVFDAIVVQYVRPGPDGPIVNEPRGYTSGCGVDQMRWARQPGEDIDQMRQRATREAARRPGGAVVLYEYELQGLLP